MEELTRVSSTPTHLLSVVGPGPSFDHLYRKSPPSRRPTWSSSRGDALRAFWPVSRGWTTCGRRPAPWAAQCGAWRAQGEPRGLRGCLPPGNGFVAARGDWCRDVFSSRSSVGAFFISNFQSFGEFTNLRPRVPRGHPLPRRTAKAQPGSGPCSGPRRPWQILRGQRPQAQAVVVAGMHPAGRSNPNPRHRPQAPSHRGRRCRTRARSRPLLGSYVPALPSTVPAGGAGRRLGSPESCAA